MKKNELKKVLKPLIKECIKECIFEEGVLSGIIKEVAQGMGGSVIAESKKKDPDPAMLKARGAQLEKQRQEKIRKLNESTSFKGVFENTKPIQDSWEHHLRKENA